MNWKFLIRFTAAIVATAALATAAEISDPVGAFRLRLRGSSDTIVSLPLQRSPLVETTVSSRSNNLLVLTADIPAIPAEGAFALMMSGALEGAVLPITAVNSRTLTVDAGGYDLATLKTVTVNAAANADLVCVVPYWTLDTLFPAGRGIKASTSAAVHESEVLLFDDSAAGVNLSASSIFFYFAGTPSKAAGWYKVGALASTSGQQRLNPHTYFVVRHNSVGDTILTVMGGVQMAGFRMPLRTKAANVDQDNLVSLPVATPIALNATRLIDSGAFRPSTSASVHTDELLVYDNTAIGYNKSPSAIFFYFAGTPTKSAGWYKVGALATTADSYTLKPGEGYVIRKQKGTVPEMSTWNGVPAYLK